MKKLAIFYDKKWRRREGIPVFF